MPPNPLDAPAQAPAARICAVMVTYNPDSPLEQNIPALLPEVDRLIIVDNGSEPPSRAAIGAVAAAHGCEVIWNAENLGLAAALNAGIRRALESGEYAWIATFDDDSRVPPGFREAMLQAYRACPYRDQIGLIGPWHVLSEDPADQPKKGEGAPRFREEVVVMQSGSFLSTAALGAVGLLDGSFFIDYVDIEFCLRLRKHGWKVIQATQARLAHRLGELTTHPFLGKATQVFNHSPVRRYYAARNRLRVYRRYVFSDPVWLCLDAWGWFKQVIKLLLYEKDRGRKLACIAEGIWDALRGRSGKYRESVLPS
jgi:rhamnosyltransferase